jgi:hypothetical protein
MKRFTILLIFLLCSLSSCGVKPPEVKYNWTGQEEIRNLVPTCIVWYKQVPPPVDAWRPYKAFSQEDANDMRNIILELTSPEKKEFNPNIESKDKLSMIFYNGFPEKLTVREVYFQIKDKTFIGPVGRSDRLAKILLEKKEVRSGFYYPYRELGSSHYSDSFHRILESQDFLRKQVKQLKVEKQTEDQKRIEGPNQAEP